MFKRYKRLVVLILIFCVFLAGCQKATPVPPTHTPTATRTMMPTLTPTLTPTPSPSPPAVPTSTQEPTPRPSPTPTIIGYRDDLILSNNFLPPLKEAISVENTDQVQAIAAWGTGEANTIALSPDGHFIAVGTNMGAYVYETTNFVLVQIIQTPTAVQTISFSSDGQMIALGQSHHTIDIIDFDDFSLISRLSFLDLGAPERYVLSVHFSNDRAEIFGVVKSSGKLFIQQWDTTTWQPGGGFLINAGSAHFINDRIDLLGKIMGESLILQSLIYPDETSTISLPTTDLVSFWDKLPLHNNIMVPSFDGNFLIISNGLSIVHWRIVDAAVTYHLDTFSSETIDPCYDAPTSCLNAAQGFSWRCQDILEISPISELTLNHDNTHFLVSLSEGRTELRRTANGTLVWEISTTFSEVRFSEDGQFFYGLNPDGSIQKRATLDGELVDIVNQHPSRLHDLAFSPDGVVLAAGYNDGWIRILSAANGQQLGVLDGHARSLAFSPDGELLAAGLDDGTVRIFELGEARYYDLGSGHQAAVNDLVFSNTGEQLLTGSDDCTASLWRLDNRSRAFNITPNSDDPFRISAVCLSPINDLQYFTGNRKGIYVLAEAETKDVFLPEEPPVAAIALSPDSESLAATGQKTWLLENIVSEKSPEQHPLFWKEESRGLALAFTPNGSILIIASEAGFEFWSVEDVQFLAFLPYIDPLPAGSLPVAVDVSPDGLLIALGSRDGLITIYGIPD